jgi:hypothetical protein
MLPMTNKGRMLAHSPRGLELVADALPEALPAMPHDAELELGQGEASLELEQREEHKRARRRGRHDKE